MICMIELYDDEVKSVEFDCFGCFPCDFFGLSLCWIRNLEFDQMSQLGCALTLKIVFDSNTKKEIPIWPFEQVSFSKITKFSSADIWYLI